MKIIFKEKIDNFSKKGNELVKNCLAFAFKNPEIALSGIFYRKNYEDQKDIDKVVEPPALSPLLYPEERIEINRTKKRFKEQLKTFTRTIDGNFKDDDLVNFKNNIKSVKIYYKKYSYRNFKGLYAPESNEILLEKDYKDRTIYHELFHLASNRGKIKDIIFGGFRILSNKFISIGESLDEGYTDNLTYRYFFEEEGIDKKEVIVYPYEFLVSRALEYIVGQNKMEKLYLNANLYQLIEELKKYADKNYIEQFFKDFDFATSKNINILTGPNANKSSFKKLCGCTNRISDFLLDIFYEKYHNEDDYEERLEEFKNILTMELQKEYDSFNDDVGIIRYKKKEKRVTKYRITDDNYIDYYLSSKKSLTK